ncbi:hypothetical protein CFB40_24865 [Burkholderia sp. AU31652]|uniref:helix-turn-helix domain-containing protein n=1 Tax=Burkholderia sp. AU31652 TaxID=2015354 RepID=UPI000B7A181B|nr:helix-turn-helix transcriptional regulator [Burkholderia sp. AU31652]OXI84268.1 hypothetical protein CFB40_24865 [Burkholderia sp. AU31652]
MISRCWSDSNAERCSLLASRVGEAIAEIRRARDPTQAKLAEMINLEQEAISRWEHGMCAPTLYRLQQPSDALDCSVDQLLQRGSKHLCFPVVRPVLISRSR